MSLRIYMFWGPGAGGRLRLLGPQGLRERLTAFSGSEGLGRGVRLRGAGPSRRPGGLGGGLVLRHREVPHLPPTFAMRLEWGGATLCYGADCAPGPELPELAAGCGVLVCEASFGAEPVPEGVPHLPAREAGRARAAGAGVGRLLLTHCGPEFDRDAALAAARAEFSGPVRLGPAG